MRIFVDGVNAPDLVLLGEAPVSFFGVACQGVSERIEDEEDEEEVSR